MKRLLLLVVLATSLIATIAYAQKLAEAEILNQYVGTWKSDVAFKPSQWFPEGTLWIETNDIQWILDDHLQQMVTSKDEEETNLRIQRYNEKSNRYELWNIPASGDASYWVGSWDEESKTMTWKYVDFGSGFTGKMMDRLTGEGKGITLIFMEDVHGNVLLDGKIEHTRIKEPTK
ncbi:hypothetical protein [Acidihalobacter prosperus]